MGLVTAIKIIMNASTILKKIMNVTDTLTIVMKNILNFKITNNIEKKNKQL